MWTGDTLHGPVIGGKKSYLFAFIDDHSRAVMGARWSHHDDVVRMAAAFRPALQARGVPQRAATWTTAAPFVDAWLLRGCAVLGIKLIHSRPGKPEGRGKIERFFRTVRDQFLVEAGDGAGIADLAEMNRLFQAWTETVYHQAVHSETGEAPAARWEKASPGRAGGPRARPAAGGVLVVRAAQGGQDGPGPDARQRLPGRRVAGRADAGAGLRPVRPGPDRGPASAGSPPGPPSRSPSAGTATPRPASPTAAGAPSPPRPGSTTSPPSATATTRPCASRSPTGPSSAARPGRKTGRGERRRPWLTPRTRRWPWPAPRPGRSAP